MESSIYQRIVMDWCNAKVALLPPCSEAKVVEAFNAIGQPVSADVCRLYTTVGGFVDYGWDRYWSLWSLDRIIRENQGEPRPFVMFADWLLWAWGFCFKYESPDVSSVYITTNGKTLEAEQLAHSVDEFLEKLLTDPESVWVYH